eukprot:8872183-Pyramimonas_sp.AAC.2
MAGSYWQVLCCMVLIVASTSVTDAQGPASSDEVVLITGATGKTGTLLYNSLVKAGHTVRGLVRSLDKAKQVLNCTSCDGSDGIYVGDVTDESTLEAPMDGARCLVLLCRERYFLYVPRYILGDITRDRIICPYIDVRRL